MNDFECFLFEQQEFDEDDCNGCYHNPKRTGKMCNNQCTEDVNGMPLEEFILMFCAKGVEQ